MQPHHSRVRLRAQPDRHQEPPPQLPLGHPGRGRVPGHHKATLADCERVLGSDHPYTLASRNNLSLAYQEAGHLEQAIPLHEAALTTCERVLGPDHPDTLLSRNNLASAYHRTGDPQRAIPLFEAVLTSCERVLGPDHPTTKAVAANLLSARVT
ncbi:hypothetical protein GCM10027598_67750 [Amycolatopsis oliviviridis]|uniref:Tetratricopeptide repeat protein n=1 Tax=Amycolatopsis oliviviridis TaxID=1471590 RepID=A0ABQ3M2Q8_9PSEU|nr:hypothetical protein GCM10017790_62980 [Amycolatopsis oliviviridis]